MGKHVSGIPVYDDPITSHAVCFVDKCQTAVETMGEHASGIPVYDDPIISHAVYFVN